MKNNHLVPDVIIDIGNKLNKSLNENERYNLIIRLETIEQYCFEVLKKHNLNQRKPS